MKSSCTAKCFNLSSCEGAQKIKAEGRTLPPSSTAGDDGAGSIGMMLENRAQANLLKR